MAPGDHQSLLHAAALFFGGIVIGPGKGNGRGVIVQFVEGQGELARHMTHQGQQERRTIATKKTGHPAARSIVVQQEDLFRGKPQGIGCAGRGPFAQAIDWLPCQKEVLDQHGQAAGGGDLTTASFLRQVVAKKLFQPHSLQQVVEDRQGTEAIGPQGAVRGTGDASRRCLAGTGSRGFLSFGHDRHLEQEDMTVARRLDANREDEATSRVLFKKCPAGKKLQATKKTCATRGDLSLPIHQADECPARNRPTTYHAFRGLQPCHKGSCAAYPAPRRTEVQCRRFNFRRMRVETPVGHLPEQDTLGKNSMTAENATSSRCPRPEELRPTLSGSAGQPLCLISTHHWAADGNPQQLIVRNAERALVVDAVLILSRFAAQQHEFHDAVRLGMEQLSRGEFTQYDDQSLTELFDSLKQRAMNRATYDELQP